MRVDYLTGLQKKHPHNVDENNLCRLFLAKWNRSQWSDDAGTIATSNYSRYIYLFLFVPERVKVRLLTQLAFLKVGYDTRQEDGSPQHVWGKTLT